MVIYALHCNIYQCFIRVVQDFLLILLIKNKNNGKATTDFKNEMLNRCSETFAKIITPIMQTSWRTECIAKVWNEGLITSFWKGKGDRENLTNQLIIEEYWNIGNIGNILEEIIDNRMEMLMKFTDGQGGGKNVNQHAIIYSSLDPSLTLPLKESNLCTSPSSMSTKPTIKQT